MPDWPLNSGFFLKKVLTSSEMMGTYCLKASVVRVALMSFYTKVWVSMVRPLHAKLHASRDERTRFCSISLLFGQS